MNLDLKAIVSYFFIILMMENLFYYIVSKKKTQKTPKNEIIKAQNEIKDYITRRKNNAK